jgi:hypothetical protein
MRRATGLIALALASTLAACQGRGAAPVGSAAEPSLLIRDVQVVSPELAEPRADSWVLLRGDRIEAVGDGEPPAQDAATKIVEGGGRFLTPGLIDGHVHLAAVAGMDLEQSTTEDNLVEAYYRQLPRSYLHDGFTTLVDPDLVDPSILDFFAGPGPAPEVLHCGGGVTVANGNHSEPGGCRQSEMLGDASVEARVRGISNVAQQGGDTPSARDFAHPPGLSGYRELRAMAAAGLSPRQIFDAATLENARLFGIDHEVGSVEVGKRADLLLLARNPLESAEAWDTLETVFVAGQPFDRAELSPRSAGSTAPDAIRMSDRTVARGGGRAATRSGQRLGAR